MTTEPDTITCTACGADVHPLAVFPKTKCLACHAADPIVRREVQAMTAGKLARMWGA